MTDASNTNRGGTGPRLKQPGRLAILHEVIKIVMREDAVEIRHQDASRAGTGPHGELITEKAGGRITHAGQAHVFTDESSGFKVELVQGDNAVKAVMPD